MTWSRFSVNQLCFVQIAYLVNVIVLVFARSFRVAAMFVVGNHGVVPGVLRIRAQSRRNDGFDEARYRIQAEYFLIHQLCSCPPLVWCVKLKYRGNFVGAEMDTSSLDRNRKLVSVSCLVVTLFLTVQIHRQNNLLLYMYNIRLPVATREAIAHRAGGQHQNIKGACVAILAAVPRGKFYQMIKTV